MAGSYPDAPSFRIAYDEDGTVMIEMRSANDQPFGGDLAGRFNAMFLPPTELVTADKEEFNDEDSVTQRNSGGPGSPDWSYSWIFPEKRDIFGFFGYAAHNGAQRVKELESSTNSNNGITGDWVQLDDVVNTPDGGLVDWSVEQSYREFIEQVDSTGARSLRVRMEPGKGAPSAADQCHFKAFHIYGTIADSANPDRLLFIDDGTGLAYDEVQDWGDIPRGSVHDKKIRILNNSATLAATSNVISFEALYQAGHEWYTIRDDSLASTLMSTSITIDGPIAAGARYPVSTSLTLRLTVPDDEDLGPNSARLHLETGTWA